MAVEDRLHVGRHQVAGGTIFTLRVPAHKDQVEVPTVGCWVRPLYTTGDDWPPKRSSRRQPHEGVGEQAVETGKADRQALIEAPASTRSFSEGTEGDSSST
jgi:hypothetical protein